MKALFDLPTDQEEKASDALGALYGLYDLLTECPHGSTVKTESISYLLKLCIRSTIHAVPDGGPKHRRAVNDLDSS